MPVLLLLSWWPAVTALPLTDFTLVVAIVTAVAVVAAVAFLSFFLSLLFFFEEAPVNATPTNALLLLLLLLTAGRDGRAWISSSLV